VAHKVQQESLKYEKYGHHSFKSSIARNQLTDNHLEAGLRLSATSIKPDISKLVADMQHHPSH